MERAALEVEGIRSLDLAVAAWPGHRAGQHIDVRLTAPDGYQAQRSYSVASAPETATVGITVERLADGEVSPYLVDGVQVGDVLEVRGPIGGPFTWSVEDGGPVLLLAGGAGLVPLMAMLRHRAAQGSAVPAVLLTSVRTPAHALYRAELDRLAAEPGLHVWWTFTRARGDRPEDLEGRVDRTMIERVAPPPGKTVAAFVCGPNGFVEQVATALVDSGHDPARVHTERFGPT